MRPISFCVEKKYLQSSPLGLQSLGRGLEAQGGYNCLLPNGDVVYKVLVSAKKFSLYPEGVIQPSQGHRPWYMGAVLTAAPAGHNIQRLLVLCPVGACMVEELATRGAAPGWVV